MCDKIKDIYYWFYHYLQKIVTKQNTNDIERFTQVNLQHILKIQKFYAIFFFFIF